MRGRQGWRHHLLSVNSISRDWISLGCAEGTMKTEIYGALIAPLRSSLALDGHDVSPTRPGFSMTRSTRQERVRLDQHSIRGCALNLAIRARYTEIDTCSASKDVMKSI